MQTIGISRASSAALSFALTCDIGLAHPVPALAVAQNDVGAAGVDQHRGRRSRR